METPTKETTPQQENCEYNGDNLCVCNLNKIVGFDKHTHALECRGCGMYERAENIGVWNKKGDLIGAICGECEKKERKEKRETNKLKKLQREEEWKLYTKKKEENMIRKTEMENSEDYKLWKAEMDRKYEEKEAEEELIIQEIQKLQEKRHMLSRKYYAKKEEEEKIFKEEFGVKDNI